jgi:glycosyltransferase involved in cell wall biosynthesis
VRILQVLPRYAPAWAYGGGVRMFWLLGSYFVERGHQVTAITSDSLDADHRATDVVEELMLGLTVRRFRNRFNRLSAHLPAVFYRPIGMRAGLLAALGDADIVHMGESRCMHNLYVAQAVGHTPRPIVWSAYGGLARSTGIRGVYRALHDVLFTSRVVPAVNAFVAQTEHEELVYKEHGVAAENIHRIPLCVDWADYDQLPPSGMFRQRLGIGPRTPLIVCVARLSPVKGIEVLIEALARLRSNGSAPVLAAVGWDHGALAELTRLAKARRLESQVLFPGPLYGDERLTAYVDADVFALCPRVFEETSLAALEAAACGTPTVLSPHCEIPGLAEAGGGRLVDRDPDAIASVLAELLGDPTGVHVMGVRAREFVAECLRVERVGGDHEALFCGLVA